MFLVRRLGVVLVSAVIFAIGCGSNRQSHNSESSESSESSSSPAVKITGRLNDTGLGFCSDDQAVELACPQTLFPQQDGDQGRDARYRQGQLVKIGSGVEGFDWTKLDSDGTPLMNQSAAWLEDGDELTGSRWSCVRDNVTGLTWEVKESDSDHPRYGGHSYSWYWDDPVNNGGQAGFMDNDSEQCATKPCNTQHYVVWLNQQELCGFNDWRMPSVSELVSIAVYSKLLPALDTEYFPNALQPRFFTHQTLARDGNLAWYVYFSDASVSFTNKSDRSYVRLVRGGGDE